MSRLTLQLSDTTVVLALYALTSTNTESSFVCLLMAVSNVTSRVHLEPRPGHVEPTVHTGEVLADLLPSGPCSVAVALGVVLTGLRTDLYLPTCPGLAERLPSVNTKQSRLYFDFY